MKVKECEGCPDFTWKFQYHNEKDGYCKRKHEYTDFIKHCNISK